MKMTKITATLKIWNGKEYEEIQKEFEVEVRGNGNVYSPELVEWVQNEARRVTNLFTIESNGRKYTYSV